jgi:hypothetical protein
MRSRDGFEVVNRQLTDEVTRRAFLRQLGWTGAGVAALSGLANTHLPSAFGQQARRRVAAYPGLDPVLDPQRSGGLERILRY